MNGFDLGWFLGVPNACTNISFRRARWGSSSNVLSKDRIGLLYLRQFPVSLSSPVVCTFYTANLKLGPSGDLMSHMNRSVFFLDSKNMQLLQDLWKQRSSMISLAIFLSTFTSFLEWGSRSITSFIKCLYLEFTPLEHKIKVLCLFFHSLELGSASLNALNSFSYLHNYGYYLSLHYLLLL